MPNLEQNKKNLQIKIKALVRMMKQCASYHQELDQFDMNEVLSNKKQSQFYNETKSASAIVEIKLMEFYQQLNACVLEIEPEIPTSVELTDLYTEAKHQLSTVQSLYPALC